MFTLNLVANPNIDISIQLLSRSRLLSTGGAMRSTTPLFLILISGLYGCTGSVSGDWYDIPVDTGLEEPENDTASETSEEVPEMEVEIKATVSVLSKPGYTTWASNDKIQIPGVSDIYYSMFELEFCALEEDLLFSNADIELRGDTDGDTEGYMNNNIPADEWVSGCIGWKNEASFEADPYMSYLLLMNLQPMSETGEMTLLLHDFTPDPDWKPRWGVRVPASTCTTVKLTCAFKDIPVATGNPDVWATSVFEIDVESRDAYSAVTAEEVEYQDPDGLNTNPDVWLMLFN